MSDGNRQMILLVDDEPLILDVCGAVLRSSGFTVVTARNARIGLELFREHVNSLQMIITDLLMPDMTGLEMVRRMKLEKPVIKSLFMSGYGAGNVITEPETGFHLIVKPFTSDRLLQLVHTSLEQSIAAKC